MARGRKKRLATGAHDRAPVVEDPARLAGLPYWLADESPIRERT